MANIIDQFSTLVEMSRANAVPVLQLLGVLWAVHCVNWLVGYRLNILGLLPRSVPGVLGIFFMPFLHGDFGHLLANSVPFFVLVNMLVLKSWAFFWSVTFHIVVISGVALWCFGRRAIHIGASGLNMGYMGYLLADVYFHPSFTAVVLGVLALYYFGTMLVGVIPMGRRESWEGHLFSLLAGIGVAYWSFFL